MKLVAVVAAAAATAAGLLAAAALPASSGKVVALRPGAVVVVAGSKIICSDTTTKGVDAVVCILGSEGRTVPKSYAVGLRENGEISVLHADAQGGLSTVYTRKPQSSGTSAGKVYPLLTGDRFTLAGTAISCSILSLTTKRPAVSCVLVAGKTVKAGSYGVILTETFATVLRYGKSGSEVVLTKIHGR